MSTYNMSTYNVSKKSKKNNTPCSLLIEGKTITNPKDMAGKFNKFFSSIETKFHGNIPPIRRHYIDYLKHQNPKTFFISPTTPDEIKIIINSLKCSKCVGPNSIPTKFLHLIKDKISVPLFELINKSFSTGCFPNICKTAKVIPILKLNQDFFVMIIDLFASCRISVKLLKK